MHTCIANQARGKVFGLRSGYPCALSKQSRTRGTVYLARPNDVVLFLGRAHHEWDEVVADMKIFAGMKILGSVGRPNYSN